MQGAGLPPTYPPLSPPAYSSEGPRELNTDSWTEVLLKKRNTDTFPTKIKMTVSYTEEGRATSWKNRHAKRLD